MYNECNYYYGVSGKVTVLPWAERLLLWHCTLLLSNNNIAMIAARVCVFPHACLRAPHPYCSRRPDSGTWAAHTRKAPLSTSLLVQPTTTVKRTESPNHCQHLSPPRITFIPRPPTL